MTQPATDPPPAATHLAPREVPARRRLLRVGIQIVGFLAGLASMAWCVSLALHPSNQEQFRKLASAPPQLILAMLGLSLATVLIQGFLFWIALLPARRLSILDISATNAIAIFLSYLPLKAGALARVIIHNRRDRIPVLLIGAWFGAVGGLTLASMLPLILATIWRGRVDAVWAVIVLALQLGIGATIILVARLFKGERGIGRLSALASTLRLKPINRLLQTRAWANLHTGFDILASPVATFGSIALRLVDAAVHSTRFLVAAHILGVTLPVQDAIPVAVTFFLIGAISPAGQAGLREGAATGLAGLLLQKTAAADENAFSTFAAVALLVTATEALILVFSAAVGVAWLRPDRLIKLGRGSVPPLPPPSGPPAQG